MWYININNQYMIAIATTPAAHPPPLPGIIIPNKNEKHLIDFNRATCIKKKIRRGYTWGDGMLMMGMGVIWGLTEFLRFGWGGTFYNYPFTNYCKYRYSNIDVDSKILTSSRVLSVEKAEISSNSQKVKWCNFYHENFS